jgi:serine/threonine protein kinase
MSNDPENPALQPTGHYDSAALNRARDLLNAPPETVGPYRILERIGGGGMGEVFRAEQRTPIRREVALKFIKLGMDTRAVIARFEAERQALALMDHPHIAKVFDAGADEAGRPYFVMEYVKGKPITDYSDQNHLTIAERLELFEQVCQAVQHAHHKGIIHRDLKPSNVLVSTHDGKPFAKVIDFGIAKAISQQLTDKTLFTRHDQFVGTPQYMSPEQAEGSLDIDTRTDVYSLGVMLYELLTGSTPFSEAELRAVAFEQIKKMIIEVEPPKPSTRLGLNEQTLPSLAALRRTEPKRLGIMVRGELDWIVMRALDKDRRRRYETPTSFANDIIAHLNREPVQAAPLSATYRFRKFVRKHRIQVIASVAIASALLLGVIGATWGMVRARTAELAALDSKQEATKERDEKETARVAEAQQRNKAERYLVGSILRPIGYKPSGLDPAEAKSFVEWSALDDSRLRLLGIEAAFDDPQIALRVARRAEHVIQAAVGLSPKRRAKVIALVSAKQRDMTADPRIRIAACWLALECGSDDLPALAESVTSLANSAQLKAQQLGEFVNYAVNRTILLQQQEVTRQLPDALITVLENSTDSDSFNAVYRGLSDLAPRLKPSHIVRFWDGLIARPEQLMRLNQSFVHKNLVALAARLEQPQVVRCWNVSIEQLENSMNSNALNTADQALVALAPQLESAQIIDGGNSVIRLLEKARNKNLSNVACEVLVALAPKLEPTQVIRGRDALIAVLNKTTDLYMLNSAREGLVALAYWMEPDQVACGGDALIAVLDKAGNENAVFAAQMVLVEWAKCLKPTQVVRTGNSLIAEIYQGPDSRILDAAPGLVALAPRLEPAQVLRSWDALIAMTEKQFGQAVSSDLSPDDWFAPLAQRLEAVQLVRSWDALIEVVENPMNSHVLYRAQAALVALATRLDSAHVIRGGNAFVALLERSMDRLILDAAQMGLVALAPRLDPAQVVRGGDALIASLEKSIDGFVINFSQVGLIALAPRLEPTQVVRGVDALIALLDKSTDKGILESAQQGFVALAPRLEREQVTRGGNALIALLERSQDGRILNTAKDSLITLAPRLEALQIVRACNALDAALEKSKDDYVLIVAQKGLLELAPRLEQDTRNESAMQVLRTLLDHAAAGANLTDIEPASRTYSNPRSIAKLLSHPGCVGAQRQALLKWFEELVLYEGMPIFLRPDEPTDSKINSVQHTKVTPERKFHDLHDAADWIQKNWPDFDLETNHPVIWRGGH